MKKLILLFASLAVFLIPASAQELKAFISHKAFCANGTQPYIEFTFIIGGNTVNYVPDNGKYSAAVDIQVDMLQNDSLVKQLHYILSSDQFDDSSRTEKPDFADIQNVPLPQGEYFLYFYMHDINGDTNKLAYIDHISLNFPQDKISTSKLSLYKSLTSASEPGLFVKYGYQIPPLYSNFVSQNQYTLPFGIEIYNTKKVLGNQKIKADCYIVHAESQLAANPNNIITLESKTDDIVLFLNEFNVFNLPSGNYFAILDLFDERDSLLITEKVFFQKSNPNIKLNIDEYNASQITGTFVEFDTIRDVLIDEIKCLYPISTQVEKEFYENRLKTLPTEQMQSFFYSFWVKRNPTNPEAAWQKYKQRVDIAHEKYGSKQVKGYLTDRGRVFLQYGSPNEINDVPSDPVTLPYEIWHYYYLNGQSNVKFVFYDPVLTGRDYELLHSNLYGEIQNVNWKMLLVRKIQPQQDIYDTNPVDYWGNDMDDYWRYH